MTEKKNILIITAFPPSNYGAGLNYTLNLINDLQKLYHIDIIYFNFPGIETTVPFLKRKKSSLTLKIIRSVFSPFMHPFYTCRFSLSLLFRLYRIRNNYDYIYFDFNQVHIYSLFIPHKSKLLMLHDVMIQKYKRKKGMLNRLQCLWIFYSEKIILHFSHASLYVFSKKDQHILSKVYNCKSNIVDFYISEKIRTSSPKIIHSQYCFIGAWNRSENFESLLWFNDFVLPFIKTQDEFLVIGGGMPQSFYKSINNPKVKYLGFVDDPYEIISHSKALIAPLFHGAGVKVKTLEAILCGIPVIGTKIAFEGIDNRLLKYSKTCITSGEFISSINDLNPDSYDRSEWKEFVNSMYPKRKLIDYLS
jgi:glycosyltransferase involved in cell wall biosynthesis